MHKGGDIFINKGFIFQNMKKIDVHCHTSNRKLKAVSEEDASLDVIAERMGEYDVEKTVVLATYFPHKQSGITNYRLLNWINGRDEFVMFGSLDFEHYFYQGLNELEEMASECMIEGIKIYTCYQEIDLEGENFGKVVDVARKNYLPIMFHTGYSHGAMKSYGKMTIAREAKPKDIEKVALRNLDVNFVMSHMGKPFFDDLVEVMKKGYPNLYTDMSGLLDSKYEQEDIPECVEEIRRFLGECGCGKFLFGTDFPVQTHKDSVYMIEEGMKGFSEEDKNDVYYRNAKCLLML
jgi:predicted TIM-barrel fold metal-dependent hydrolase